MRDGTDTFGQRLTAVLLAVLATLVLVFLVVPILIVVPLSFSSGSFFFYPLPGFSLRDYQSSIIQSQNVRMVPSFRGLSGSSAGRTLVLLDGVPQCTDLGQDAAFGLQSCENLERILVIPAG